MTDTTLNVIITFFDDLEWLQRAVASIPDGLRIYAVDGRYEGFDGDYTLTPGAAEWAVSRDRVSYVAPPDDRLPWGHDWTGKKLCHGEWLEAKYINYEVLPQDEWVLKVDTDEEVTALDQSILPDLNRRYKYTPYCEWAEGGRYYPHRLYVPKYWTFWVDDVMFPREFYPRDTDLETLVGIHSITSHNLANHGGIFESDRLALVNHGQSRDPDYLDRREQHLDRMNRTPDRPPLED